MISGLTLLDRRIKIDAKVHLSLIFVWKKKQPHDCSNRNLVVECFSMKMDEVWIHFDVISTSWSQGINFSKDRHRISSTCRLNLGSFNNHLFKCFSRINISSKFICRNVESNLRKIYRSIIIVAELQSDLILGRSTMVDVTQRNLKSIILSNLKPKNISIEACRAPIPAFNR